MADATTTSDTAVFTVTPEAIERILELREAEDDPTGLALRVEVTGTSGAEYAYDLTFDPMAEADEADAQFRQGDLPVLVPTGSIEQLAGATLDIPSGGGPGLVLRNPNRPNPLSGKHLELTGTIAEKVQQLLAEQINPALAAHGGFAELKGVEGDGRLRHDGRRLPGLRRQRHDPPRRHRPRRSSEAIPEVTEVVDTTDHDAGENPFYT